MYQCRTCRLDPWIGKMTWRRTWQPSPVFLPGEFHGQMSLEGYTVHGVSKSQIRLSTHAHCILNHICSIVGTDPPWRHSKDPSIAHVFNSDQRASQSVCQIKVSSWLLNADQGTFLGSPFHEREATSHALAHRITVPCFLIQPPWLQLDCLPWWIFQTVFICLKYKPKVLFSTFISHGFQLTAMTVWK